jgi:hypothetical protein
MRTVAVIVALVALAVLGLLVVLLVRSRRNAGKRTPWTLDQRLTAVGIVVTALIGLAPLLGVGGDQSSDDENAPTTSETVTLAEWASGMSDVCRTLFDDFADVRAMPLRDKRDDIVRNRAAADAWERAGNAAEQLETPPRHAREIERFIGLFDAIATTYDEYAHNREQSLDPLPALRAVWPQRQSLRSEYKRLAVQLQAAGCGP